MGSGCSSQSSVAGADQIRSCRQGNLTFYIHENKASGKGCRRTIGWHSAFSEEEVKDKIQEFWDTRVNGDPAVWAVLKQACELDTPESTEQLLKANRLSMPNGLLQQVFDKNSQRYDLPPFVINPPLFYEKGVEKVNLGSFAQERIKLVFRSTQLNDFEFEFLTTDKVEEVKERLKEKTLKKIRLFYGGKELKNGMSLGNYGLKNDFIVQLFFCD